MKKILNRTENYVMEMLEGLCAYAHPSYFKRRGAEGPVLVRPEAPIAGKVGIVTGGGSGHLPVFTGYVGPGLLDACAIGEVFASPGVEPMAEGHSCRERWCGCAAALWELWRRCNEL